jgi:hypothetical protein
MRTRTAGSAESIEAATQYHVPHCELGGRVRRIDRPRSGLRLCAAMAQPDDEQQQDSRVHILRSSTGQVKTLQQFRVIMNEKRDECTKKRDERLPRVVVMVGTAPSVAKTQGSDCLGRAD